VCDDPNPGLHDRIRLTMRRIGTCLPFLFALSGNPTYAMPCEKLTALTIPATAIASAVTVPAGPFSPGGAGGRGGAPARSFPAFCRVTAIATPVPDSEIHLELWLPESSVWNGKLLGTGNGGYSGAIGYTDMERGLRQGYAVAGSGTGHQGGDLKFGAGHPEKINDWAWRAVHVMTETARLVAPSYYGRFAAHSYFSGCSTGGQQGLTEAQRYPGDYDGILAGDLGNNRVRLNIGFLWSWLAANADASGPLPVSKLALIDKAAIAACDAADGVEDGIICDPLSCKFDPADLQCDGNDGAACPSKSQVAAVRAIYDGAKNPRASISGGTGSSTIPIGTSTVSTSIATRPTQTPKWGFLRPTIRTSAAFRAGGANSCSIKVGPAPSSHRRTRSAITKAWSVRWAQKARRTLSASFLFPAWGTAQEGPAQARSTDFPRSTRG
jgi:feruloyl esterase